MFLYKQFSIVEVFIFMVFIFCMVGVRCKIDCIMLLACFMTKTLVTQRLWRTCMNVSHGCQAPTGHQRPYHGLMSYVQCWVYDLYYLSTTSDNFSFFSLVASLLSSLFSLLFAPSPILSVSLTAAPRQSLRWKCIYLCLQPKGFCYVVNSALNLLHDDSKNCWSQFFCIHCT